MRAVSTFSLRSDLSRYLEEVARSETPLIVSRFGKPLVVIEPYTKSVSPKTDYFGFLGKGETGTAFLRRVRRSAKEKRLTTQLRRS